MPPAYQSRLFVDSIVRFIRILGISQRFHDGTPYAAGACQRDPVKKLQNALLPVVKADVSSIHPGSTGSIGIVLHARRSFKTPADLPSRQWSDVAFVGIRQAIRDTEARSVFADVGMAAVGRLAPGKESPPSSCAVSHGPLPLPPHDLSKQKYNAGRLEIPLFIFKKLRYLPGAKCAQEFRDNRRH